MNDKAAKSQKKIPLLIEGTLQGLFLYIIVEFIFPLVTNSKLDTTKWVLVASIYIFFGNISAFLIRLYKKE